MFYSRIGPFNKVSKLCFGCEPLGGFDWGSFDVKDVIKAVKISLDHGVNFFDTALVYGLGNSEKNLRLALSEKRHDSIIATKGGLTWENVSITNPRANTSIDISEKGLKRNLFLSMRNLKIDVIPLYYLHRPPNNKDLLRSAFNTINEFKHKGYIRSIGCSNVNLEQLKIIEKICKIDVLQISDNVLMKQSNHLINFCKLRGIPIASYNILSKGLLTGKYSLNHKFEANDRRSIHPLIEARDLSNYKNRYQSLIKEAIKKNMELTELVIRKQNSKIMRNFSIIGIKNSIQLNSALKAFK